MENQKVFKRKKLYKVFDVSEGRALAGPYTSASYWWKVDGFEHHKVKLSNAPGWVSDIEKNPCICKRGWHAYDLNALGRHVWGRMGDTFKVVFVVELRNCYYGERKWVGEQVKIIRRYTREEYREWQRDQKRARRA